MKEIYLARPPSCTGRSARQIDRPVCRDLHLDLYYVRLPLI